MQNLELERETKRKVEVEESLETLSHYLDDFIRVPGIGWRFGLDSIVGLVPGVGDVSTLLASFYILTAAVRYRVPKITILRMALNLVIDFLVGSIPFLGDVFDFVWKSNRMNMDLLRSRARVSAADAHGATTGDWLFVGAVMLFLVLVLLGSLLISYLVLASLWRMLDQIKIF